MSQLRRAITYNNTPPVSADMAHKLNMIVYTCSMLWELFPNNSLTLSTAGQIS